MERIWAKLAEHDKRFDKIEAEVSGLRVFILTNTLVIIGTVATSTIGSLALVYAARQDTTATISTALTAIQTALAARPADAPSVPPQPNIIVVPIPMPPGAQGQPAINAPAPSQRPADIAPPTPDAPARP
ncbi:hypothetical protein [Salinarimonas soli]|uniref:Uncharacterized protein n=1 Tax=Salinarimonas soli TaxID=1638099 RepID=A0A5B2VHA0_9HYPH|nr:hypothetical protein [Salinarimonas soli]KAA2237709.1 hypothetical protein F0L46_08500 [Salinarimonas soli]